MVKINEEIRNVFVSQVYGDAPGLGVASCGYWIIKYHLLENRTRKDYLIIYCISGSGVFIEGKKEYKIRQGMLFVAFPDIVHSLISDNNKIFQRH